MCRGGRMFAPTKTWRKWHRKVNLNQRRYATVSALAASALPALVMARGHRIGEVNEIPCVVDDGIEKISRTRDAVALLTKLGAGDDIEKSKASRKIRTGIGKLRNRRHVQRRGPLVVYNSNDGVFEAFRNVSGVDCCPVSALNLLSLAPGGHVGRFVIFSESAFRALDGLYGNGSKKAAAKKDYILPRHAMANADVVRLINSDEVQSVVRPANSQRNRSGQKKNPLRNLGALLKINPYAKTVKRNAARFQEARIAAKK